VSLDPASIAPVVPAPSERTVTVSLCPWESHHKIDEVLAGYERQIIEAALAKANHVQAGAARLLGITRYSLGRRFRRLKMDEAVRDAIAARSS